MYPTNKISIPTIADNKSSWFCIEFLTLTFKSICDLLLAMWNSYLVPKFELFLLKGSSRYTIESVSTTSKNQYKFYRVKVEIYDNLTNKHLIGFAEAESRTLAEVRAFAEAYERGLLGEALTKVDTKFPWGVGCALKKVTAIKRAYGEYYERKYLNCFTQEETPISKAINTPYGDVYIYLFKKKGLIGSGYGLCESEAKNSALRSLNRNEDYKLEKVYFKNTETKPEEIQLSRTKKAWLECWFVGHTSQL